MIQDLASKNASLVPGLFGLAICGGKSSRMGTDKSMLNYFGKPQCYYVYEMLSLFCEKVFISCNEQQADGIDQRYETLPDLDYYNDCGPMGGLLTAFTSFPHNNFLMIGCDYPFLNKGELAGFLPFCSQENSVVFFNEQEYVYEPMIGYYHHSIKMKLLEMFKEDHFSLQHFLKENDATRYYPKDKKSILSIDTAEEFTETKQLLKDLY